MMRRNLLSESVASVSSLPANPVFKLGTNGLVGAQNNIFLDTPTNSRTANTITRYGNVTQGTFTPYSKEAGKWSYYFGYSASGSRITTNLSFGTFDFAIEADVFATNYQTSYLRLIYNRDSSNNSSGQYLDVFLNHPSYQGKLWDEGADLVSTINVPYNKWFKFKYTRVGNTFTFYIDGVACGSKTVAHTINTAPIYIGNDTSPELGYISNLRITKAGVVVLDTCKDNRFKDNSVYNHTLTPTGNVKVSPFSPYANSVGYDAAVYGGSGYFDGSGDYLAAPSSANFAFGTGDFSIEADVYLTFILNNPIIDTRNSNSSTAGLEFGLSSVGIYVYGIAEGGSVRLFEFNKVKLDRVSGTLKGHINGNQVFSIANTTNFTDNSLKIGSNNPVNSLLDGYISNLKITKVGAEVLNLKFNNAGIRDESGMNCIETVGDAKVSSDGQGVVFDGSGDRLTLSNNETSNYFTGDFTIETTFSFSNTSGAQMILGGIGNVPFSIVKGSNGYINFDVMNSKPYLASNVAPSVGVDYAVKVTKVSNTYSLYVNEVLKATASNATSVTSTNNLSLGMETGGNYPFFGTIKNLTITKGA
jgi:hypothetical protein